MKKMKTCLVLVALVILLGVPIHARAVTQGDFALALAQIAGFEANTIEEAMAVLSDFKISPLQGWKPQETMTPGIAREVEEALNLALAAGLLKPVQVEGSIEGAMAYIGLEYAHPPSADKAASIPWLAPLAGPPAEGVIIEASPYRPSAE